MFKDLVSYGADSLKGDTLEEWVDAALDTTLITLSAIAPELAPGMVALREVVNAPTHDAAESARRAIKQWSIGQASQQRRSFHHQDDEECKLPAATAVDMLFSRNNVGMQSHHPTG